MGIKNYKKKNCFLFLFSISTPKNKNKIKIENIFFLPLFFFFFCLRRPFLQQQQASIATRVSPSLFLKLVRQYSLLLSLHHDQSTTL